MKTEIQLNILHKTILRVALALRKKHRTFDMLTLFERCRREIPYPEPEIDKAIRELYEMKYIVPGKILFKHEVLENIKRNEIYEYVLKYPGAHQREIRKVFALGSYETQIHLAFLVSFDYLRMKFYKNRNVYFPLDFNEALELETLILKNETTRTIFECIKNHEEGRLRLSEIADLLQIPYTTIQSHLKELQEGELIEKIEQDQVAYYVLPVAEARAALEQITEPPFQNEVEIKREFDYVGGKIRFKVVIRNFTDLAIHNISVNLNASDQFIADIPQQKIANLPPKTTRGVDFDLTPLTCGQSKVFGAVSFEDAHGNAQSLTIQPKEISIKCPLVIPLNATQNEVNEWIQNLKRGTSRITYHGIPDAEAFRVGREQVSALDLNEINIDNHNLVGLFSGQVKVTGNNTVVKLSVQSPDIILDVWADDLKQTTGFLAYITNLVNIALEVTYKMVRKTEDSLNKIINLSKISEYVDGVIIACQTLASIQEITTYFTQIQNALGQSFPDSVLINSIQLWDSKLKSHFDLHNQIESSLAIELQYKGILWLYKLRDLIQTHMKMYQDTFDDYNQFSQDFSSGLNFISEKIYQHEKIYGKSIMTYLLITDKKSGICLFEKKLSEIHLNPDLIGGFLHALQSFGLEISETETSMKTLSYQNYQFQIETGEFSRVALIVRGEPNSYLKTQLIEFVKQFEHELKDHIVNFTGNMDDFKPAIKIFENVFE